MQKVIAIFDIGKTNKKLLLFNSSFEVVFQKEEHFPLTKDDDGFECDDIDLITNWIEDEVTCLAESSVYDLIAVNFSTYGASLIFLDSEGNRLTPLYNYLKPIDLEIANSLFNDYGNRTEFCRCTASPSLEGLLNSGIQLLWLKKNKPDKAKRVKSILHLPQYLSYCLTGEIISEPTSIGCHTMMWNFDKMDYHKWVKENDFNLPEPINNDIVFGTVFGGKEILVGTGIHDSSSSLVPFLDKSSNDFILASTGTWCINMNPFNKEPLTKEELLNDCLCYLTPARQQVKSSRLFMGHFHQVAVERLSNHFDKNNDEFTRIHYNDVMMTDLLDKYDRDSVFFPEGKDKAEQSIANVDLKMFKSFEEAYHKLMIDITRLFIKSLLLIIATPDTTKILYVTGGFSRNLIFIELLKRLLPDKIICTSEIDNATALGAALVIKKTIKDN